MVQKIVVFPLLNLQKICVTIFNTFNFMACSFTGMTCIFKGLEENEDDLYLDYTMLPSDLVKDYDVTFEEKETLFVKRWKPDALQVRQGLELRLNLVSANARQILIQARI